MPLRRRKRYFSQSPEPSQLGPPATTATATDANAPDTPSLDADGPPATTATATDANAPDAPSLDADTATDVATTSATTSAEAEWVIPDYVCQRERDQHQLATPTAAEPRIVIPLSEPDQLLVSRLHGLSGSAGTLAAASNYRTFELGATEGALQAAKEVAGRFTAMVDAGDVSPATAAAVREQLFGRPITAPTLRPLLAQKVADVNARIVAAGHPAPVWATERVHDGLGHWGKVALSANLLQPQCEKPRQPHPTVLPRNYHRLCSGECLQKLCVPRTGRSPTGKATSRARVPLFVRPPEMPCYPSYGPIRPAGGP